jgi:hypothetical protein
MNRYITFFYPCMYMALLLNYCQTFGTQSIGKSVQPIEFVLKDCYALYTLDGCNYSYDKVPANSTCNITEGGSAIIGCDAIGICNTFTVHWFKHTTEGSIRVNRSENKYEILIAGSQFIADCHCRIGTSLTIYRFNHSDNGYYWCQIIVSDNSRLVQSSPRGYVAMGEITNEHSCTIERRLFMPTCAEDATSLDSERRCTSQSRSSTVNITPPDPIVTIGLYSTHIYNTTSTTAVTSVVTLSETPQQNMVWVYGVMIVFLLVIIVLVLSLVLVSISKCRTQQKSSKRYNVLLDNNNFAYSCYRCSTKQSP